MNCKRNVKPEMAELKGKRLIISSEMEEGMRLNTAVVKQLCSTDEIQAEKKYKELGITAHGFVADVTGDSELVSRAWQEGRQMPVYLATDRVADALLARAAAGLPVAVGGLNPDAAAELRRHIDAGYVVLPLGHGERVCPRRGE